MRCRGTGRTSGVTEPALAEAQSAGEDPRHSEVAGVAGFWPGAWSRSEAGGVPGLHVGHERSERAGGEMQNWATRVLGVTHGNDAVRGDEVGGDLDAVTAVVAVRGLEPTGDSVVTGCPFATG